MKLIIKKFNEYSDRTGSLVPFYLNKSFDKFQMKRFFFVYGKKNKQRADHAHKKCNQIYIPVVGDAMRQIWNTKKKIKKICLSKKKKNFLIVPKMNWIKIKFKKKNCVLLVLCDYKYDKKEYIQNKKNFLNYAM